MRDCDFVISNLGDWTDGLLDDVSLVRFNAHVKACDACAKRVADERQLSNDLAVLNAIGNRIAAEGATETPVRRMNRGWRVAAAFAVLAGSSYVATSLIGKKETNREGAESNAVAVNRDGDNGVPAEIKTTFTLPKDDTRLSVRIPSEDPHIHVFWLYTTAPANDTAAPQPADNDIAPGNAAPSLRDAWRSRS